MPTEKTGTEKAEDTSTATGNGSDDVTQHSDPAASGTPITVGGDGGSSATGTPITVGGDGGNSATGTTGDSGQQ